MDKGKKRKNGHCYYSFNNSGKINAVMGISIRPYKPEGWIHKIGDTRWNKTNCSYT